MAAAVHFQIPLGEHGLRDGGGLAYFDAAGKQTRLVDTGDYLPTQVAFADDRSLWMLGDRKKTGDGHAEYFILRHLSPDGRELGGFLPRSSCDAGFEPSKPYVGAWSLRVTQDRIGALLHGSQGHTVWVEFDLAGKELGRWPMSMDRRPGAFTQAGTPYAEESGTTARLDRTTGEWRPAAGMPDSRLLGADGNTLVFMRYGSNVLNWVAPGR